MKPKTKRIYLILIISLGLINLNAQSILNVNNNSGSTSTFELTNIKKITFSNGNLNIINLYDGANSFEISAIKRLDFRSTPTSITIQAPSSNIKLFPNPASEYLNIVDKSNNEDETIIEISDIDGKLIQEQSQQLPCTINISSLKNGIYFCRIKKVNKIEYFKFIKH